MLEAVTNKNELSKLVFKHIKKNVLTNCFLSSKDYEREIENGTLLFKEYESNNLYIIKKRDGFIVLYYYINDDSSLKSELERIKKEIGDNKIVIEVAYEETNDYQVKMFEKIGFEIILNRVNLHLVNRCLEFPPNQWDDIIIKEQFNLDEDSKQVFNFIKNNFNIITGCIPSVNEIKSRILENEIKALIDKNSNNIIGVLEFNKDNDKKVTIKHLAVLNDYRGKGIGSYLLRHIQMYYDVINVWTTINSEAERLYIKNGFAKTKYKSVVLIDKGEQ